MEKSGESTFGRNFNLYRSPTLYGVTASTRLAFWRLSKTNNTLIENYVGIWHRFEIILTVNNLIFSIRKRHSRVRRGRLSGVIRRVCIDEWVRKILARWVFTVVQHLCVLFVAYAFRRSIISKLASSNNTIHFIADLQRFRDECVAAHNFYRAAHGTPPICWSTKLAESAQNWADQLASATGSLRYSSAKGVGENLACLWGSELNGQKVTRIWYEEVQHFDYYNPCVSSRTRSFAQVVWEGTREFGAGAAVTKYGKQIVVARYFPPMNKKDVARNVKKVRCTRDDEQPLAYDTRWSRLYVGKFWMWQPLCLLCLICILLHRFICMK